MHKVDSTYLATCSRLKGSPIGRASCKQNPSIQQLEEIQEKKLERDPTHTIAKQTIANCTKSLSEGKLLPLSNDFRDDLKNGREQSFLSYGEYTFENFQKTSDEHAHSLVNHQTMTTTSGKKKITIQRCGVLQDLTSGGLNLHDLQTMQGESGKNLLIEKTETLQKQLNELKLKRRESCQALCNPKRTKPI